MRVDDRDGGDAEVRCVLQLLVVQQGRLRGYSEENGYRAPREM